MKARLLFEDDLQRFQSMKGDMESMQMVGSEQLTSKLEEVNSLNHEISQLNQKINDIDQKIKETSENILNFCEDRRFVKWLQINILNEPIFEQ